MPVTAALWTAGFLAVAGSPPFGLFISELLIFKGMNIKVLVTILAFLCCAFLFSLPDAAQAARLGGGRSFGSKPFMSTPAPAPSRPQPMIGFGSAQVMGENPDFALMFVAPMDAEEIGRAHV